MIKWVVSDLDGTLLHRDFSYSTTTMEAISSIQKKGMVFLPATGRRFQDIIDIFHSQDIKCGGIVVNGAQAFDANGTLLQSHWMENTLVEKVIQILENANLNIQLFDEANMYSYQNSELVAQAFERVISRNMDAPYAMEQYPVCKKENLSHLRILKIETMSLDNTLLRLCEESLSSLSGIQVSSSVEGNLEITPSKSSKGEMLEVLIKQSKIEKDEVLIFGDSTNDLSMFQRFPHCIAVRNAHPKLCELASYICDSCEEDGVAKVLFQL